jgi:hypothetical protein
MIILRYLVAYRHSDVISREGESYRPSVPEPPSVNECYFAVRLLSILIGSLSVRSERVPIKWH